MASLAFSIMCLTLSLFSVLLLLLHHYFSCFFSDTGIQRFVYRDGKRIDAAELEKKGEENARYKTQDIEAGMKRHHQLLRRQHFMDRKSGPPRPIF